MSSPTIPREGSPSVQISSQANFHPPLNDFQDRETPSSPVDLRVQQIEAVQKNAERNAPIPFSSLPRQPSATPLTSRLPLASPSSEESRKRSSNDMGSTSSNLNNQSPSASPQIPSQVLQRISQRAQSQLNQGSSAPALYQPQPVRPAPSYSMTPLSNNQQPVFERPIPLRLNSNDNSASHVLPQRTMPTAQTQPEQGRRASMPYTPQLSVPPSIHIQSSRMMENQNNDSAFLLQMQKIIQDCIQLIYQTVPGAPAHLNALYEKWKPAIHTINQPLSQLFPLIQIHHVKGLIQAQQMTKALIVLVHYKAELQAADYWRLGLEISETWTKMLISTKGYICGPEALNAINMFLDSVPLSYQAQVVACQARVFAYQKQETVAIQCYGQAISMNPNDSLKLELVQLIERSESNEKALEQIQLFKEQEPEKLLWKEQEAQMYLKQNNYAKALEAHSDLNQTSPAPQYALVLIEILLKQDPNTNLISDLVLQIGQSGQIKYLHRVIQLLNLYGQVKQADALLESIPVGSRTIQTQFLQVSIYYGMNKYLEALTALNANPIQNQPYVLDNFMREARIYLALGFFDGALVKLKSVLNERPSVAVYALYAEALIRKSPDQNYEEALQYIIKAEKMNEESPQTYYPYVRLVHCEIEMAKKERDVQAIRSIFETIQILQNPFNGMIAGLLNVEDIQQRYAAIKKFIEEEDHDLASQLLNLLKINPHQKKD